MTLNFASQQNFRKKRRGIPVKNDIYICHLGIKYKI